MQFANGDVINVTGHESLKNAICIAIMTRYNELNHNKLYNGFGCRIHELIKANKSHMVRFKIELFIQDVLTKMRRVKSVNFIEVIDNHENNKFKYFVKFSVTCINDEIVEGDFDL